MLFKEIEAIFTQKVMEFIQKGYTFNCNTMSGSQGEIGKVDLSKGNEIIRVLMGTGCSSEADTIYIIVGRSPEKVCKNRYDTIWNNKLEIIEKTMFFKVSENFFVETEEEYRIINDIQIKRHRRRAKRTYSVLKEDAKKIVLPFVKRQSGFKSCKLKDIDRVEKFTKYNRTRYEVVVKGKVLTLH